MIRCVKPHKALRAVWYIIKANKHLLNQYQKPGERKHTPAKGHTEDSVLPLLNPALEEKEEPPLRLALLRTLSCLRQPSTGLREARAPFYRWGNGGAHDSNRPTFMTWGKDASAEGFCLPICTMGCH